MMKRSMYNRVVAEIERMEFDFKLCVSKLTQIFPNAGEDVLRSVAAQQYQKRIKKVAGLMNSPGKRGQLYREFWKKAGDDILRAKNMDSVIFDMSKKHRYSPVLLSKIILEEYLKSLSAPEENECSFNKEELTAMMRCPFKIPDRTLAAEAYFCRMRDEQYGQYSEAIKHCTGIEYETRIKQKCQEFGLSYKDENILRAQGYDKTPDIVLDVPIAVNGCAVNWIESKALFGDDDAHKGYLTNQLWSYWNRFGPGLVIYWFGYIEDLGRSRNHGGILLRDSFPDDFTRYDPDRGLAVTDNDWGIEKQQDEAAAAADEEEENYDQFVKGFLRKKFVQVGVDETSHAFGQLQVAKTAAEHRL